MSMVVADQSQVKPFYGVDSTGLKFFRAGYQSTRLTTFTCGSATTFSRLEPSRNRAEFIQTLSESSRVQVQ